jgi:hypothetical protein
MCLRREFVMLISDTRVKFPKHRKNKSERRICISFCTNMKNIHLFRFLNNTFVNYA